MPKYQSEFPQYVIRNPERDNFIEVEASRSSRLGRLQAKNEQLTRNLEIFSRRAYSLQIENAKLLAQNRRLKKRWLTETCIMVSAISCLALILHVWS